MLKQLKHLTKKDWLFALIIAAFVICDVYCELKIPEYMQQIVITIKSGGTTNDILANGAKMLMFAVFAILSVIIAKFFSSRVAIGLGKKLRSKIYNRVIDFSDAEIKKFSTSSLINRTTNDVVQVQSIVAMGLTLLVKAPVMAVMAIIKIVNTNLAWTLATAIAVGIIFITLLIITFVAIPKFKKIQTLTDNLNKITRENLTGTRVVRAFNAEDYQQSKFEKANEEITDNHLFISKTMSLIDPTMTIVMNGLPLAVYIIGAILIYNAGMFEKLSILANMTVFGSYSIQVIMSFIALIMIFMQLPRAQVSARRINEVLETKSTIEDGKGTDKPIKTGEIQFVNVGFKYPEAEEYVLHDINFKVKQGEVVAFIGSTGSGKSTLINLVPRIYDATEGQVIVDGVNVKDYTVEQLNDKIGYISQKAILFSGTVKSNVTMGLKNGEKPTDEDVKNALDIAQAKFVYKLDGGVEARIDQGGKNVSGGQKQRISIARALARKPEILIFDDSFSALDYKTDKALREALKTKAEGTTCLIVAQRIGTIKNADKIIVLDKGSVVGEGKHDELMKNCSIYKEIALSQLSKEELKNA
ncbi:MAG: ABC transporter ATP-binding protein [Clostridia bacterium]|nr:ABC transporter ATP-binding protein [Clostridia bacterium]